MKIKLEPFIDDETKQYSLSRILIATIVVYCMWAMWGKDIPVGWAGLVASLYVSNKASSTYKEVVSMKGE